MLLFDRATDLQRAFHRVFRTVVENQRHAVAGGELKQTVFAFRSAVFVRGLDDLVQLPDRGALIVDRHLRIGDNVDEENVRDLERDLLFNFGGHLFDYNRSRHGCLYSFGAGEAASFWKRGSFRSGSNIGSSRSSAGVSGTFSVASGPPYGIESSFCKAAMARSGSLICAATRARISIGIGPNTASFSIGTAAIACSVRANAAAFSPTPILVSERVPMRL